MRAAAAKACASRTAKPRYGEGFARARSEAKSSFGDERVFIEKFITDPRHIEIQVLGDKYGNIIHLGERECSIQRRNQKVVEEAPSPLLDAATRKKMGDQAVALAKAVGYDSAGTVEFVAGQDKSFYFLEMNTRLQVEHPVTELITGIDLVEQMIRVAAGEKLSIAQGEVKFNGWAVESRVYAEDPYRNFLPSTGRLTCYRPPQEESSNGITVRNDTGVYEGGEISLYYDPMIAKLVTHAPTRAAAITAQSEALDRFVIDGIRHNVPFLAALMAHPGGRPANSPPALLPKNFLVVFIRKCRKAKRERYLRASPRQSTTFWASASGAFPGSWLDRSVTRESRRAVWLGDREVKLEVKRENGVVNVRFDRVKSAGRKLQSDWKPGEALWIGTIDDRHVVVQVRGIPNGFALSYRGVETSAYVYTEREAGYARLMPPRKVSDTGKQVLCPMPGLVVSIAVKEGQEVKAGETVAVVEAMKMENVLRAEIDGTVKRINAKPGDSLAVDAVILEFT